MTDAATIGGHDPETYAQRIWRCMEAAQQRPPEGLVVQGCVSRTGSWMELAGAQHAQEALDYIQESDGQPPSTHEQTAAGLILAVHSWTWNHTITLNDKTGPSYARTATCRPTTAATGKVSVDWTPPEEEQQINISTHHAPHGRGDRGKETRRGRNPAT